MVRKLNIVTASERERSVVGAMDLRSTQVRLADEESQEYERVRARQRVVLEMEFI